ncbi:hypothetical protein [Petrimonas sulfuriphila]|uniref:hypothetical protein n=1 Tax=Petrimonas sulfuriphila TaxID=285070 RepID=UPI003EBE00DE
MKPVKLEIITEAKGDGFDTVSNEAEQAKKDISALIAIQRQYIANIRQDLAGLKKDFANSSDAEVMKPLAASISELESELKDAEFALALLEKTMDESEGSSKTLRTQIRQLEMEMANMTEGTDEYRAAMERLGVMRDRMGDISQQGRVLADDEKNIRATADAIAGLSGAMSAGVGIASMFGTSQEKLAQIQTRLQAVMATTIGLQQVAQTLNKDSYFSIVLLSKAKKGWAAAQALLNTQLGIGAGLSKALMFSGVGLLIAGITSLVVLYNSWKKKQAEVNALKQQFIDIETETAKAMAKSKVEADQLHRIASDQTKDYEVREKAINRLKSLMPEYNGHINREGVLVDNANTALKNYLVTLYKVEKAKKLLAGIEEDQGNLDAMRKKGSNSLSFWETMWIGLNRSFDPKAGDKVMDDLITKKSKQWVDGMTKLEDSIKEKNKSLEELVNDKTIFDALFGDDKKSDSTTSIPTAPENKAAEQRLVALRKVREMEISIMEEGEAKRKAQAELEFKNKLDEISREKVEREKHLKELAKAKIPVSQEEVDAVEKQAWEQVLLAKIQYENQIRKIDEETARNYKTIQNEIRLNFETRLNQQLADADSYYNDLAKKAAGNATLIAQIENARVTEKQNIRASYSLQQLDLEEQIALKRAAIVQKQLRLQTQAEEESLRIQVESAKKRLQKLRDLQNSGTDAADDIALVSAEVDDLNAKLAQMPVKKFQELADYAQRVLSGLGDFAGNFDEDLGKLGDMLSGAVGGAAELGMGIASGNPQQIIQGSLKLLETAGKIIRANKEANEEIRKYNLSLAQQAIDYSIAVIRAIKDVKSETDSLFTDNYTNTLTQGMNGYNAALQKQAELMRQLRAATVKTGVEKKKFLGITYGTRDVYDNLLKQYPDLIKADGQLNKELAETLLQSGNLSEETKNLVSNIIKAGEAANEAMSAVENELQNLVGGIGSELRKVLDDAFASGTDSGVAMAEKIAEKLKDISSVKLYNAIFGGLYADLEKRMKESYGAAGDQDLTDDLDWFMQNYPQLVDQYNEGLSKLQKRIKEVYGTDPFATESGRTATQKGIAQASQDSIDETNGRLTNIQGSLLIISERTVHIADLLFSIFAPLNRIAENTDRLEGIEKESKKTRETLEKMERDGINLKR